VLEVPVLGTVLRLPIHGTRRVAGSVKRAPGKLARRVRGED